MGQKIDPEYSDFTDLKEKVCEEVTEQNAQQKLDDAKKEVMNKVQTLDVRNITEVKNLYLIVAQLTQAAAYVAAIKKAESKNISFDEAIASVGVDEISLLLLNAFKDHPQVSTLSKINTIDKIYEPDKQSWAALHCRMVLVANCITSYYSMKALNDAVSFYKNHLESKLEENGIKIPLSGDLSTEASPIIQKLIIRYESILQLESRLENKEYLTLDDKKFAKQQVKKCLNNTPYWSERPFLQKLTDVLSLGMTALYRSIISKEKELEKAMEPFEPKRMK